MNRPRAFSKVIAKFVAAAAAGLAVLVVAVLVLLATPIGKHVLARFAESQAERFIKGRVTVGQVRGNLWSTLTVAGIEVYDEKGELAASIANIDVSWRLDFSGRRSWHDWRAFQILLTQLTIEQPRLYLFDLAGLIKTPAPSPAPSNEPARAQAHRPVVWLEHVRVVEGRVEDVAPINLEAELPRRLDSLPVGRFFAGGRWHGLPVHVAAWVRPRAGLAGASRASGAPRVSAVAKAAGDEQTAALVASLGQSELALSADGVFDLEEWRQSTARIELTRLHEDATELAAIWPSLPRQRFDGKAFLELKTGQFKAGVETHVDRRGKLLVEAHGEDLGQSRRLVVDQARIDGRCPLLVLKQPAALELKTGDALPTGQLTLEGCAGAIEYNHRGVQAGVHVSSLQPGKILEALALKIGGVLSRKLGTVAAADLEFPRGLRSSDRISDAQWTLALEMKDFGLARLSASNADADASDAGFVGVASGKLQAAGSLESLKAHVDLNGKGLGRAGFEPRVDLAVSGDYDGEHAAASGVALLVGSDSRLEFKATADAAQKRLFTDGRAALKHVVGEFDFGTAKSRFATLKTRLDGDRIEGDLAVHHSETDTLTALLTDAVRTTGGVLDADFHFAGPLASPEYRGYIRFDADQLTVSALGTTYDKVGARLKGDANHIVLESLSVGDALRATGDLRLQAQDAAEAFRFHADLKNFKGYVTEALTVQASGHLELTADRTDASFKGRFDVKDARAVIPDLKGPKDVEPTGALEDVRIVRAKHTDSRPGFFSRLHGMIDVKAPGAILLLSADKSINIELSANAQAGLDADKGFVVVGDLRTIRGDAEVFGRRFEVRPSEILFQSDPANPHIDATAIYHAPVTNVVVTLNGDLQNLKPKLSSDPPGLSEDQSLGVLLTGSPDFNSRGGGNGTSASAAAGNVASGFLLGQLKTKLGSSLPIDSLTADLGSQDTTAASQTGNNGDTTAGRKKIEVGKYVSDRIFVKVGRVFSSEDQASMDRLMVDYRLSSRWSIQTSQTDQGQSDLQVLWTVNY